MRVRVALRTLVVGGVLAAATGSPVQAGDSPAPAFVWTGGSELASGDERMSAPGNWAGGVAPASGQRVQLVFPALDCVAQATCEQVLNDVPDLVVESLRVTTPRRTPVMYWYPEGYVLKGLGLRLHGPLVSTAEQNAEAMVPALSISLPLDLGSRARRWRLSETWVSVGEVVGKALTVRTRRGGGIWVQGSITTERYVEHGNGTAEVFGGSVNTKTRGEVTYRGTALNLIEARLGSLTTEDVDLKLTSASEPNRVLGPVTFDADTRALMQMAQADHPLLTATGPLDLVGLRLEGAVSCGHAELSKPFTVLRGSRLRGRLSDGQGRLLENGAILPDAYVDLCENDADYVVRVGYTRRALTFTLLKDP